MGKVARNLRRRFTELLQSHPSFKTVLDDGKTWLCPYCGVPAVGDRGAPNFEDLALGHLLEKCPRANGLEGTPLLTGQLGDIVRFFRLKARYLSEPAWRIRVAGGVWLCPFCVQPTKVRLLEEGGSQRPADDVVRDIHGHLAHCYHYSEHPESPHSVEEVKAALNERKRQGAMARMIAERVGSDPIFQFSDENGRWICPFCEKPIEMVDFSTPLARTHAAPRQVLAHFQSGSCAYKGGPLDPNKSLADMQQLAQRLVKGGKEAEPAAAADAGTARYLETLRTELGELRSHLEENKDLRQDLERARLAQQRMLPSAPPAVAGYDLAAYFLACEQVSGDFYDFVDLGDGRLGIIMGDVSGHGIDAGIVMGMAKKAFALRAQSGADPVTVAAQVNNDISPDLGRTTFVSAVYAILDPHEHTFHFVRCGHTFPIHCLGDEGRVEELRSDGMVLGSVGDPLFTSKTQPVEVRLDRGNFVVLLTDGLIEAMTEEGEEFGTERTNEAILRHGADAAQGVVEGVLGAIHVFTRGHPQNDDRTMLVIQRQS